MGNGRGAGGGAFLGVDGREEQPRLALAAGAGSVLMLVVVARRAFAGVLVLARLLGGIVALTGACWRLVGAFIRWATVAAATGLAEIHKAELTELLAEALR